nr:PREDICTED: troponin T, cardiac muscle-like isoform X1 [Bemisia tabaci]
MCISECEYQSYGDRIAVISSCSSLFCRRSLQHKMEGTSNECRQEELKLKLRMMREIAAEKRAQRQKAARERERLRRKQRELERKRAAELGESLTPNSKAKKRKSPSPKINKPLKMFGGRRKTERESWIEKENNRAIKKVLIADERQTRAEQRHLRKEQLNSSASI